MASERVAIQHLLTLPPRMAAEFQALEGKRRPEWFASYDPPGKPLGSGGGTANLLADAWRETGTAIPFDHWLRQSRKLVLHAGGQSRRLPSYGPTGKLLMPIPVFRWARGQKLDQTLMDLQVPDYDRVLRHAGSHVVAMITSGDVLLRFGLELPPFPEVDVLGLGMRLAPEHAKDFGVFFCPRQGTGDLAFFLQKPAPARIRELADTYQFLVDTGMWLLSERAVNVLMQRCHWNAARQAFENGEAGTYEFYAQFALALGTQPTVKDPGVNGLTSAVVALPDAEFYHFGTNRQMVESVSRLQNLVLDESKTGLTGLRKQPDQVNQNSRLGVGLKQDANSTIWIENSVIPAGWQFASEHVLTGVPENDWALRLEKGVCLDFVPVGQREFCVRVYGFDDAFSGALGSASTVWLGRPAEEWFQSRGISLAAAGLDSAEDIQRSKLFPVIPKEELTESFVQWLFSRNLSARSEEARRWLQLPKLSASDLNAQANVSRVYEQRRRLRRECLLPMLKNFRWSVFFRLDLESTARAFADSAQQVPELSFGEFEEPMQKVHYQMFHSAVSRHRNNPGWAEHEQSAFGTLRNLIAHEAQLSPALPRADVLEDQIVWARSPVRLDLAGGWTDTPPYCIEHGGKVLNVAVDLNGQPPIQVFARLAEKQELVMRSIDLGLEERIRTYEELDTFNHPDAPFALAKAALALAGFLPRFHADGGGRTLKDQLKEFGGGIEISLLSAVPKGSGLGTSSILAATVLAALGDLCGLGWDRNTLFTRTLALEQMLTTGGGWQDQAGAIFRGIKLIETSAGLAQRPVLSWLPDHLFGRDYANGPVMLYYTGITRLAKNILAEIVRGIFLNSPTHLSVIAEIGKNADYAAMAVQKCDYGLLQEAIRRSWILNQELDAGTNPPAVNAILERVADLVGGAKLLGAGGGGYLLMLAKDQGAAARIKQILTENPPNRRARFVDFKVSERGLQLTRS